MKKLLLLLFSFLLLSSPSVFAETYSCDGDSDGISTILKRQGSNFSYKSWSNNSTTNREGTLKIVHEDSKYLFLMGNFWRGGSTVVAINKISNDSSSIFISPRIYGSSKHVGYKCTKR